MLKGITYGNGATYKKSIRFEGVSNTELKRIISPPERKNQLFPLSGFFFFPAADKQKIFL